MNTCNEKVGSDTAIRHRGVRLSRIFLFGLISGSFVIMSVVVGLILWALTGPLAPLIDFGENWSANNLALTQQRGQAIVQAINAYHQDADSYPESLRALVPHYLNRIDPPLVGNRKWSYGMMPSHPKDYYLSVQSIHMNKTGYNGVQFYQYNSVDKEWAIGRYDDEY